MTLTTKPSVALLIGTLALLPLLGGCRPEAATNSVDAAPPGTSNTPNENVPDAQAQAQNATVSNAKPPGVQAAPSPRPSTAQPLPTNAPREQPRSAPIDPGLMASARRGTTPPPMTQEGDGEVKLLGICSYAENSVKCWKPDGSSAKNLEPTVDSVMRSDSGNRGRMRYGYKNRALVFSRPARVNVSYRNPEGGDNGGMFETQSPMDSFGPKLEIVFASTSMGNSVGTIVARVQGYEFRGKTGEMPMKPGSQLTVDGIPVKIGAIKKIAANDPYANFGYSSMQNRPRWKAEFVSDRRANPEASVNYELLGADGSPIQFVDEKGHPKARAANPMMGYNSNGMMNAYQMVGNTSGGTDLVLMVDPAFVKRVRVTVMRAQLSMFKDIPLDPKG